MTTITRSLTEAERVVLCAVMDRFVPPVDDLPGAGTMGLLGEVEAMASKHAPFRLALCDLLDQLATEGFAALAGPAQDDVIGALERAHPVSFNMALEVVYLAYYGDPRVHRRIGWRSGPLQPDGFTLPPFDEAILEKARQRQPFWRPVPA